MSVCEFDKRSRDLNKEFELLDSLFGAVRLTKNAVPDKYGYCGTGLDACLQFSLLITEWSKNVVIFVVEDNSPEHTDHKRMIS